MGSVSEPWRVKLYKLNVTGEWDDCGTGFIRVEKEGANKNRLYLALCSSTPSSNDGTDKDNEIKIDINRDHSYQRQGDNIITWTTETAGEGEVSQTDLALSFQENEGCREVWRRISTWLDQPDPTGVLGKRSREDDNSSPHPASPSSPSSTATMSQSSSMTPSATSLPPPADLHALYTHLVTYLSSPPGKHAQQINNLLVSNNCKYLHALLTNPPPPSDPPLLSKILRTLLTLNITEVLEFFTTKAETFNTLLGLIRSPVDPLPVNVIFRAPLPYDKDVEDTIRQSFRLEFIRDKVCRVGIDGEAFSSLNSIITFNSHSIVKYLAGDYTTKVVEMLEKDCRWVKICPEDVLQEGYERLTPSIPHDPDTTVVSMETEDMRGRIHRRLDCLNFLHQFFTLSRTLQPSIKEEFYSMALQFPPPKNDSIGGFSIFSVLSMVLNKSTTEEKLKCLEILTNILLYDPDFVRAYVCTHNSEPKVSLKDGGDNHRTYGNEHLIDYDLLLHLTRLNSESSEAVVVGAAEVVKLIVNGETFEPGSVMEAAIFNQFYDHNIDQYLLPLLSPLPPSPLALFYTLEVLCFCVRQHPNKFKFFLIQKNVAKLVLGKMRGRDKFLCLSSLRFIRSAVGMNDAYVYKYLIKQDFFSPIIASFHPTNDNLLSSAVIEMVDQIRQQNARPVIKYLVEGWREKFQGWSLGTFEQLVELHDANLGGGKGSSGTAAVTTAGAVDGGNIMVEGGNSKVDKEQSKFRDMEREESYFGEGGDDEEEEGGPQPAKPEDDDDDDGTSFPSVSEAAMKAVAKIQESLKKEKEKEKALVNKGKELPTKGSGIGGNMKGGKKILNNLFPYGGDDSDED